ncbi:MAG: ATP synthase F1 subunit gamma [Bacteroidales bacterium]|nr:ATP synthase F1 subunit gamma [Bacteroidales bacterium]
MANLKGIRMRINSVRTTRQVTSAMKMVSAAKLNKAQSDVEHVRPFVGKLLEIVNFLGNSVDGIHERFAGFRVSQKGKILFVSIASNKGLAGAFNSNVAKETERLIKDEYSEAFAKGEVEVIAIGKQVAKGLAARGIAPKKDYNSLFDNMSLQAVYDIADELTNDFVKGEYREIHLVFNEFVNKSTQRVASKQFLPLALTEAKSEDSKMLDFIVEPNKIEVLEDLVPQAVRTKLYATLLDSIASEHSARMTSMSKATDNATELLKDLQLQYNKARQSAITGELIEIVSGAEALNG